jgi:hypothetical protein
MRLVHYALTRGNDGKKENCKLLELTPFGSKN